MGGGQQSSWSKDYEKVSYSEKRGLYCVSWIYRSELVVISNFTFIC